jgi:hypothetical protein
MPGPRSYVLSTLTTLCSFVLFVCWCNGLDCRGLDETIKDARVLTLRRLNLADGTADDHAKLAALTPSFQFRVALKTKEIIIEEELRVRRCAHSPLHPLYIYIYIYIHLHIFSLLGIGHAK